MVEVLSHQVNPDFIYELANRNPGEAVKLLILYLKLKGVIDEV